jgi:hypothetical protein
MKKLFSIIMIAVLSLGVSKAQTVIYSQDFSGGIPASWGNSGTANGVANSWAKWRYTHNGSHGAYGSPTDFINSPTKANGFIIFDSDSLDNGGTAGNFGGGPAPAPQTVALTTSAIDVTGYPYCRLTFNQYFRNFQSTTVVGISTDSINWTLDTINASIAVNANTPNTSKISVDLSPVINAGGAHNKVYVSFIMDANYYFWMIDDINITTLPDNNLSIKTFGGQSGSNTLGLFYSQIPASEADSFFAVARYGNIGQVTQPNTKTEFKAFKTGTLIADSFSHDAVALPYSVDTFGATQLYTQGIGKYVVAINVSSDSTDFDVTNNVDSIKFAVTDSVFSINSSKVQNGNAYFLLRNNAGVSYRLGTLFELDNADTVTSVTTALAGGATATHAGAVIQASIYPVTVTSTALQYSSPVVSTFTKTLTAANISPTTANSNVTEVVLPIDNSTGNAVLPAGTYWVAIGALSTPDSNVLIAATNYQTNGFPVVEQNNTLFYLSATDAAYCNLNFGHPSSLLYADWTRNPATTPLRTNHSVTFTGITNGSINSTYAWNITGVNSGVSGSLTGKVASTTFTVADSFYVCLTVTDGGSTAQSCKYVKVVDNTGINDVKALTAVALVPNPSTGCVTISADDVNGAVSISVVNLLGEVVKSYNETSNGSFSKTYNMSDLSNGMYMVKISNAGSTVTKSLSISK